MHRFARHISRLGGITMLALFLSAALATSASAQMREFTGMVDKINDKKVIIDNRQGDKVSFNRIDTTTVEGEKASWDDLKKGDWVTVHWKFVDKPRKAYKMISLPPREEPGEDE